MYLFTPLGQFAAHPLGFMTTEKATLLRCGPSFWGERRNLRRTQTCILGGSFFWVIFTSKSGKRMHSTSCCNTRERTPTPDNKSLLRKLQKVVAVSGVFSRVFKESSRKTKAKKNKWTGKRRKIHWRRQTRATRSFEKGFEERKQRWVWKRRLKKTRQEREIWKHGVGERMKPTPSEIAGEWPFLVSSKATNKESNTKPKSKG